MINSIIIHTNKVLKITNVCIIEFNIQKDDINFLISKMENYIKSKGATPIGPLIQKTEYSVNEEGQLDIKVYLMRQANNFIHNVEAPYNMESVLRVCNCMYARYTGPEEKLFLSFSPSVEKQQHFLKVLSRMADQVKFQLK